MRCKLPLETRAWVTAMLTTDKGNAVRKDKMSTFIKKQLVFEETVLFKLTPIKEALLVALSQHSLLLLCGDVVYTQWHLLIVA